MTKYVAKTIKSLPTDETFLRILDPKDDVCDVIVSLKKHWSYDLYTRRPGPALLEDGALKPTDLDLACFLSALADRKAVINLPTYRSRRPRQEREGEVVVSKNNRHGKVLGLTANKEVFSFSVKVEDVNVVSSNGVDADVVGAPRNFMLVDLEGDWYDGWKKVEFMPSRKENDFLEDKELWTGNTIYFENFVHPNRWVSLYGRFYILTKVLVDRLRAEAAHCFQEVKSMQEAGIVPPPAAAGLFREWPESKEVGPSKSIQVRAFEAEVDADVPQSFPAYARTGEGLVAAKARLLKLRFHDVPELSFAVRATEMAFCQRARCFDALPTELMSAPSLRLVHASSDRSSVVPSEPFPAWISGASWTRDYKIKRTLWNRLVLHQQYPFARGLALRYRVKWKAETVAAEQEQPR